MSVALLHLTAAGNILVRRETECGANCRQDCAFGMYGIASS